MPRLLVFGGAGFLGSQVSRAALRKGWQVTCVSRSGRPSPASSSTSSLPQAPTWHDEVEWVTGDAFTPSSYAEPLCAAQHVVTTIGVLDYRGFMRERRPGRVLDKLSLTLRDAALDMVPTSLLNRSGSSSSTVLRQDDEALRHYDLMNRDAAIAIAEQVARHENVRSLVYVSAAAGFPGIPARYMTSKRAAESHLMDMYNARGAGTATGTFRPILFRPGFMFSDHHDDKNDAAGGKARGFTKPVARVLGLSYALNSALGNRVPGIGAAGVKPLAVERVGSAIVEACDDERIVGPVEVHQIEALADVRWRAEMIV